MYVFSACLMKNNNVGVAMSGLEQSFTQLNSIICTHIANRGLQRVVELNDFSGFVRALDDHKRVIIVTGFCIKDCLAGETDGPLGSLVLGKALENLGRDVVYVTDKYSGSQLEAGVEYLGMKSDVLLLEDQNIADKAFTAEERECVIFIERPGRSNTGRMHSMSGEDITDYCPDTTFLKEKAEAVGKKTFAIGDGGNEMGMANIRDIVVADVPRGEQICTEIGADYLLATGVSNWGAYGLARGLSLLNDGVDIGISLEQHDRVLEIMVEKGAVDGVNKIQVCTVDGFSLEENQRIFTMAFAVA